MVGCLYARNKDSHCRRLCLWWLVVQIFLLLFLFRIYFVPIGYDLLRLLPGMKYYTTETYFKYPWEDVMTAVWRRYPNPFSRHVLSEDVISRRVEGPLLISKRLLMKTNPIPKWGQRFVHIRQVAILEESIIDRQRRILVTYTRNLGYTSTINAIEKCIYEPSWRKDGDVTQLKREAWIDSRIRGLSHVMERFGIERYKHNANLASKGLNYALSHLFLPHPAKISSSSPHPVSDLVAQKLECAAVKTPM